MQGPAEAPTERGRYSWIEKLRQSASQKLLPDTSPKRHKADIHGCGAHAGIGAALVVSIVAPALAVEASYIIFDDTLNGCTIATAEPTHKTRYKVLGKYKAAQHSFIEPYSLLSFGV
jgi:hypothetical protein